VICRGDAVLRNPTNSQVADCLGFNEEIDQTGVNDFVIVRGGPAGRAAAVYGAWRRRAAFAYWSAEPAMLTRCRDI
jgi:hypothetical protein